MSNEVEIRVNVEPSVVVPSPQELLAQVVDAVRRDSQDSPAAYLADSTVPHGGE